MARAEVHSKLGRVDEDGKFRLADVPREEIEEARAKARKAIAAHVGRHFGAMRPAEAGAAAASHVEEWVRGKLTQAERARPRKPDEIEKWKRELARILGEQGRFSEAAEVHPDGERRAIAAHLPDDGEGAWCACPEQWVERDGSVKPLRALLYESIEVPSEVHAGVVRRYRCKLCGHRNITSAVPPQDAWYWERLARYGLQPITDEMMFE